MAATASPSFLLVILLLIPSISAAPSSPSPSPLRIRRWARGFRGAVAADERRCSVLGRRVLSDLGGNAADSAVAVAFCLGVVNPQSSGIGGGAFLLARFNSTVTAYDFRESAPGAATADMYSNDSAAQLKGGLSVGTPGEVAGLYELWRRHGRLPWRDLVIPAAEMAREGFTVEKYLAKSINSSADYILADSGLRNVFAPNNGTLLRYGDICFRPALASTLEAIARHGPAAFYAGPIAANLVADVQAHGGILTLDDLASYSVKLRQPTVSDVLGLTVYGMPPPSSGGACLAMVLNILAAYPDPYDAVRRLLGLHRLVEAFKYAFAARMYLGDPDFVDVSEILSEMLNASLAAELQQLINDNQTFPPPHYGSRWNQVEDHGTSHFNVVDEERNVVSMTSTVNYAFGAKFISESTGIVLNNEMGDFSVPEDDDDGGTDTPPSLNNFIEPYKRPLSAMSPTIVVKDGEVLGVLGGSGGVKIITTTIQVFLDVFWKGYGAVESVMRPRLHHQLMPDELDYEDWTAAGGEVIREREEVVEYLSGKGHNMTAKGNGAAAQLIVQALGGEAAAAAPPWTRRRRFSAAAGQLTAVSDLRKDGYPSAF